MIIYDSGKMYKLEIDPKKVPDWLVRAGYEPKTNPNGYGVR